MKDVKMKTPAGSELIIPGVLNVFQLHYWRFRLCELTFSQLFGLLNIDQVNCLYSIWELNEEKCTSLDSSLPSSERLVTARPFSVKAKRFIKVTVNCRSAFNEMAIELRKNTGKQIYILSGYRTPAHQGMLFLKEVYLQNFNINQAKRLVKLPGESEHNSMEYLAIDVGQHHRTELDSDVKKWLSMEAKRFGFVNSYPENNKVGMEHESWHWRYSDELYKQNRLARL